MASTQIKGKPLTEQQLADIKAKFKKFDKDGNGTLDKDELRSLLEETLKRKITDKMMDSYVELQFSAEDKNSNRLIELDEFISLYSKIYLDPEVLLEISKY